MAVALGLHDKINNNLNSKKGTKQRLLLCAFERRLI